MKILKLSVALFCLTVIGCNQERSAESLINENLVIAEAQYDKAIKEDNHNGQTPRSYKEDGSLLTVTIHNWTSGFFAGNMWYMYELTGDQKWADEAVHYTEILSDIQHWSGNHDVGFMINCSYGNGLRLTDHKEYEGVLVNTAESLSKRFNSKLGVIKSWDSNRSWDGVTVWKYPVIIDNMMNLELLFEASILSGNDKYKNIAITHAETTMKNHYRPDYSCYHVVNYDQESGEPKEKETCQGFTNESSWARGQAWGLYGYTLCYRYTKDPKFLEFAENIAKYMINYETLPEDLIPHWDYQAGKPGFTPQWDYDQSKFPEVPRDVSAAVITASALLELAKYSKENKDLYLDHAKQTLFNVSTDNYRATVDENNYFILKKSVGSIPHGAELSVPLSYADYYFLEALVRFKNLDE